MPIPDKNGNCRHAGSPLVYSQLVLVNHEQSFDQQTTVILFLLVQWIFLIFSFLSVIFRVYCADHTYCTLRLPVNATAETIKLLAADKLKLRPNDELMLVEVKSTGERVTFKDDDIGIPTALSLNGRIFVSPKDHLDALVIIIFLFLSFTSYLNCVLLWFVDVLNGTRRRNRRNWSRSGIV